MWHQVLPLAIKMSILHHVYDVYHGLQKLFSKIMDLKMDPFKRLCPDKSSEHEAEHKYKTAGILYVMNGELELVYIIASTPTCS